MNTARIKKLYKKARILKVELRSALDRNNILQVSKYLKDDLSAAKIFITNWLQLEEFRELRVLQNRCRESNYKIPALKNGRKPFVVISGELMERTAMGSLRPFRNPLNDTSGSSNDKKISSISSSSSSAVTIRYDSVATNANHVSVCKCY